MEFRLATTSETRGRVAANGRLLVFTLDARSAARRHPLLPPAHRSEEVHLRSACFDAVVDAGRATGLDVVVSSPAAPRVADVFWHPQGTGSFGERLSRAIAEADGEGALLVVGTDSPGLGATHFEQALGLLARDPDAVVLGPSRDGGFYLLATARPLGNTLEHVPWCGPRVREALVAALRRSGRRVHFLAPLLDLDGPADLRRWLHQEDAPATTVAAIAASLRRLIAELRRWLPEAPCVLRDFLLARSSFGRGPPSPAGLPDPSVS